MPLTVDPDDPRLKVTRPDGQQEAYLVLSEEERAKGFVRPLRYSYVHVGPPQPKFPLRGLTESEGLRFAAFEYVAYEEYPKDHPSGSVGRYWTQAQLTKKGCGTRTTMGQAIAETYARSPHYYGGTYCCGCSTHFPVGAYGEFVWDGTEERVGT